MQWIRILCVLALCIWLSSHILSCQEVQKGVFLVYRSSSSRDPCSSSTFPPLALPSPEYVLCDVSTGVTTVLCSTLYSSAEKLTSNLPVDLHTVLYLSNVGANHCQSHGVRRISRWARGMVCTSCGFSLRDSWPSTWVAFHE